MQKNHKNMNVYMTVAHYYLNTGETLLKTYVVPFTRSMALDVCTREITEDTGSFSDRGTFFAFVGATVAKELIPHMEKMIMKRCEERMKEIRKEQGLKASD